MTLPVVELPIEPSSFFAGLRCSLEIRQRFSDAKFLLSLSGGADSVLAFHFLCNLRSFLGLNFSAVHFNHHLRGAESDGDELFCTELCRQYDVSLQVVHLSFSSLANLQNEARRKRLVYLKKQQSILLGTWLVTGHHRDDSVESFLISLHQGRLDQRLFFLSAFDEKFCRFRPLANLSKKTILKLCQDFGYRWREDLSNYKEKYLRNFYRQGFLVEFSDLFADIAQDLKFSAERQNQLFTQIFQQLSKLSPKHRLWKKLQAIKNSDIIQEGWEIKKHLLNAFSMTRKLEFLYDFFQRFWPTYLPLLDVKRLKQIVSSSRAEPAMFVVTKKANSELILWETSQSYAFFAFF